MSELRIEKRRVEAALTLTSGAIVRGWFFLSFSRATQSGPERVADLLNAESGFFPFELADETVPAHSTVLYNRSQVVVVTLIEGALEAQLDPGYAVAPEHEVRMLLSTGQTVDGRLRVYCPAGRDRLSDSTRVAEMFRYVETETATVIVNSAHIVELRETNLA